MIPNIKGRVGRTQRCRHGRPARRPCEFCAELAVLRAENAKLRAALTRVLEYLPGYPHIEGVPAVDEARAALRGAK